MLHTCRIQKNIDYICPYIPEQKKALANTF